MLRSFLLCRSVVSLTYTELTHMRNASCLNVVCVCITWCFRASAMNVERGVRWPLLARLCPNATGADIRSVCTEAGMFAIRSRRKVISEKDFLDAVDKVIKGYQKFSATPKYMVYN